MSFFTLLLFIVAAVAVMMVSMFVFLRGQHESIHMDEAVRLKAELSLSRDEVAQLRIEIAQLRGLLPAKSVLASPNELRGFSTTSSRIATIQVGDASTAPPSEARIIVQAASVNLATQVPPAIVQLVAASRDGSAPSAASKPSVPVLPPGALAVAQTLPVQHMGRPGPMVALVTIQGYALKSHTDVAGHDMHCHLPECQTSQHGPWSLVDAASLCSRMPQYASFVWRGTKDDWQFTMPVWFKTGATTLRQNPSMSMLVKDASRIPGVSSIAAAMGQLQQSSTPPASPQEVTRRLDLPAGACTGDEECAGSAVCLPGSRTGQRECYTLPGPWFATGLLRRRDSSRPVRFVDGFIFNDELDILELRLAELYSTVDVFVLVEAPYTFTNKPKPLVFDSVKDTLRFKKYAPKIAHVILPPYQVQKKGSFDKWEIEAYCRNAIAQLGLPRVKDSGYLDPALGPSDLVSILDLDEIPKPTTVSFLKEFVGYPDVVNLALTFFTQGFMWLNKPQPWPTAGGAITTVAILDQNGRRSNDLRKGHFGTSIWLYPAAGWHCSWCFR